MGGPETRRAVCRRGDDAHIRRRLGTWIPQCCVCVAGSDCESGAHCAGQDENPEWRPHIYPTAPGARSFPRESSVSERKGGRARSGQPRLVHESAARGPRPLLRGPAYRRSAASSGVEAERASTSSPASRARARMRVPRNARVRLELGVRGGVRGARREPRELLAKPRRRGLLRRHVESRFLDRARLKHPPHGDRAHLSQPERVRALAAPLRGRRGQTSESRGPEPTQQTPVHNPCVVCAVLAVL
jgi:hypothetical protein